MPRVLDLGPSRRPPLLNDVRLHVNDVRLHASYDGVRAKGVELTQEPTEQPYGPDFRVRDPFGIHIGVAQMFAAPQSARRCAGRLRPPSLNDDTARGSSDPRFDETIST
jgi:hypothetical protein